MCVHAHAYVVTCMPCLRRNRRTAVRWQRAETQYHHSRNLYFDHVTIIKYRCGGRMWTVERSENESNIISFYPCSLYTIAVSDDFHTAAGAKGHDGTAVPARLLANDVDVTLTIITGPSRNKTVFFICFFFYK